MGMRNEHRNGGGACRLLGLVMEMCFVCDNLANNVMAVVNV